MSKRVPYSADLEAALRYAIGDSGIELSKFAVYEARVVSTEPLTKGGLFHKARIAQSGISQMEAFLNREGGAIPLQIMHNTEVLPIGKVFRAKAQTLENGEVELRAQFAIPLDKTEIVNDIDNSVIDEVSIGAMFTQALCSECGFDYYGPASGFENFVYLRCDEGHEIGVDGCHVRLVGLDDWMEVSLVGQGAAKNPKILSRAKQSMSKETVERLAASKGPAEARILTATLGLIGGKSGERDMTVELKEFIAKLEASATELATREIALEASKALVAEKDAKIVELTEANKALTDKAAEVAAKLEAAEAVEAKLAQLQKDMEVAAEMLSPHVKASLIASGVAEGDVPADLTGQIKLVEDRGLKLHQIITPGAKSAGQKVEEKAVPDLRKGSFKLSN